MKTDMLVKKSIIIRIIQDKLDYIQINKSEAESLKKYIQLAESKGLKIESTNDSVLICQKNCI